MSLPPLHITAHTTSLPMPTLLLLQCQPQTPPPTHSHFNWTTKRFEDPQLERQRYFLEIPPDDFHMDFTIFNGPPLGLSPDDRQRAQDLIAMAKPILQQYTIPSLTSPAHCMQQPLILPVVLSYLRLRRMHIEAWAKGQ